MTRREHFEQWMKHNHPHIPLEYNSDGDYYNYASARLAYQAWKEAPLRRPCEKSQITKEQLEAMKADDPKTLVDRLNGWYSQTPEPYAVPKVQQEAARRIEALQKAIKDFVEVYDYGEPFRRDKAAILLENVALGKE